MLPSCKTSERKPENGKDLHLKTEFSYYYRNNPQTNKPKICKAYHRKTCEKVWSVEKSIYIKQQTNATNSKQMGPVETLSLYVN